MRLNRHRLHPWSRGAFDNKARQMNLSLCSDDFWWISQAKKRLFHLHGLVHASIAVPVLMAYILCRLHLHCSWEAEKTAFGDARWKTSARGCSSDLASTHLKVNPRKASSRCRKWNSADRCNRKTQRWHCSWRFKGGSGDKLPALWKPPSDLKHPQVKDDLKDYIGKGLWGDIEREIFHIKELGLVNYQFFILLLILQNIYY